MYEHQHRGVLPWPRFLRRAGRHLIWGVVIALAAVSVGTIGYHVAGRLAWLDSFLNASMIPSGMGPVDRMETAEGKLFAAFFALFSGIVFIAVMGIVLAPWVHRMLHITHLDEKSG